MPFVLKVSELVSFHWSLTLVMVSVVTRCMFDTMTFVISFCSRRADNHIARVTVVVVDVVTPRLAILSAV